MTKKEYIRNRANFFRVTQKKYAEDMKANYVIFNNVTKKADTWSYGNDINLPVIYGDLIEAQCLVRELNFACKKQNFLVMTEYDYIEKYFSAN